MAAIVPVIERRLGEHSLHVQWSNVTEADTFVAVGGPWLTDYADRNVQIAGTFGGATVVINGTNFQDGSNLLPVTDPQGNAISKSAAALEQITENTLWIAPTHSGGAAESVTVILLLRRQRSGTGI